MLLLQLSSAQGPEECCLAVSKALAVLVNEADYYKVKVTILEREPGADANTLRSVLVGLDGEQETHLAARWVGTIQWICKSPYRPRHQRKNWFIGIAQFAHCKMAIERDIRFETCKASGAGGQHVNTTDSAVRATHLSSGISVKVQTERSQHANKRLAILLIAQKLHAYEQSLQAEHKASRRLFHHQIERGGAKRVFKGLAFEE